MVVPVTQIVTAIASLCWFAQGSWTRTRLTEEKRQLSAVVDETIIEDGIR